MRVIRNVAGTVMGVGDHLVRHVLLLREQLLQADDTGQQESDLGEKQRLADEQRERLERQTADQADLQHRRSDQRAYVVVLLATT